MGFSRSREWCESRTTSMRSARAADKQSGRSKAADALATGKLAARTSGFFTCAFLLLGAIESPRKRNTTRPWVFPSPTTERPIENPQKAAERLRDRSKVKRTALEAWGWRLDATAAA